MKLTDEKRIKELEAKLKAIEIKTASVNDETTNNDITKAIREATSQITVADLIFATPGTDKVVPLSAQVAQGDIAKTLKVTSPRINNPLHYAMKNTSPARIAKHEITFCRFAAFFVGAKKPKWAVTEISDIVGKERLLKKAVQLQIDRAAMMGAITINKDGTYDYDEELYKIAGRKTPAYPHRNDVHTWFSVLEAIKRVK